MSDITGFGKMNPFAFRDELNVMVRKRAVPLAEKFKAEIRAYVKSHTGRLNGTVEFPIVAGDVVSLQGIGRICSVSALPAIKEIFEKEGISLEWGCDGRQNGSLLFWW